MMTQDVVQQTIPEIVACLKPLDPARVILFGSGARGDATEVNDLDLIVVTKSAALPSSYREKEAITLTVAQALREIRRRVPLDLIVHTQAMHAKFAELNSQFAKHVLEEGVVLIGQDSQDSQDLNRP